jgi:hypothetical protein
MTTITLQVPDQLARRLNVERERLPQLLEWALERFPARPTAFGSATPAHVFAEMIDFLSNHPTTEQILTFQISPRAQTRLSELLEKNREGALSESESAELDWYEYVHDIMTRLKAQVRPAPAG